MARLGLIAAGGLLGALLGCECGPPAGPGHDAGLPDSGTGDGAVADAGPGDAGPGDAGSGRPDSGIWTSTGELANRPMSGAAWVSLKTTADGALSPPELYNQDSRHPVQTLAHVTGFSNCSS